MCFLQSTFLNRDFSLDIVRKCNNFFTVVLRSVLEGSMSHFFDKGFNPFNPIRPYLASIEPLPIKMTIFLRLFDDYISCI